MSIMEWLQLINVLLVPMLIFLARMDKNVAVMVATLKAHEDADALAFANVDRRFAELAAKK